MTAQPTFHFDYRYGHSLTVIITQIQPFIITNYLHLEKFLWLIQRCNCIFRKLAFSSLCGVLLSNSKTKIVMLRANQLLLPNSNISSHNQYVDYSATFSVDTMNMLIILPLLGQICRQKNKTITTKCLVLLVTNFNQEITNKSIASQLS